MSTIIDILERQRKEMQSKPQTSNESQIIEIDGKLYLMDAAGYIVCQLDSTGMTGVPGNMMHGHVDSLGNVKVINH